MSFARYSDTKCLTTREIEDILEDPAFWEDMNNNNVDADEIQIVIVPAEPGELTDIENFEKDNLGNEEEVKDIAGNVRHKLETFKYLGVRLDKKGNCDVEIGDRIESVSKVYHSLSNSTKKTKVSIFKAIHSQRITKPPPKITASLLTFHPFMAMQTTLSQLITGTASNLTDTYESNINDENEDSNSTELNFEMDSTDSVTSKHDWQLVKKRKRNISKPQSTPIASSQPSTSNRNVIHSKTKDQADNTATSIPNQQ
ncbi:hypothetical protein FQA39_LY16497 [Lamprigera yunnana]|nr:hypothetical protein FQA39_LY16497 [Lamprigera yunnana]